MNKNKWLYAVLGILFIGLVVWLIRTPGKSGKLDSFATCLKDNGTKFYGAFWCPHCQNQKALFGRSAKLLPYIECSTPDGKGQNELCTTAGITGYPTWEFAGGNRENGEVSLERLSELSNCPLPKK
jgi:hypothetical protein